MLLPWINLDQNCPADIYLETHSLGTYLDGYWKETRLCKLLSICTNSDVVIPTCIHENMPHTFLSQGILKLALKLRKNNFSFLRCVLIQCWLPYWWSIKLKKKVFLFLKCTHDVCDNGNSFESVEISSYVHSCLNSVQLGKKRLIP